MSEQSAPQAREAFRAFAALRGDPGEVGDVRDLRVPTRSGDVAARLYRPPEAVGGEPCLVYFHGGGWTIGDIETHDAVCRSLCRRAGIAVLSVDYRLAPEHAFPASFDDAVDATRWAAEHAAQLAVDRNRLAIGGDSAGANLAAAVAIALRGEVTLRLQLLIYPVTDLTMGHDSYATNGEGYVMTRDTMKWFVDNYLQGQEPKDPRVSPLYADDVSGTPPALVITAEYDVLRDEGEAYATKLREAGVPVELARYDGQIHGFFGFVELWPDAIDAHERAATALRAALS